MLSWISSEYFARSPVLTLPVLALVLFMTVFAIAAVRAALANRAQIERLSRMPLDEEAEVDRG